MSTYKKNIDKTKEGKAKWYFLITVLLLYISIYIFSYNKMVLVLHLFIQLVLQIFPIFFFVYIIMFLVNYFINNEILLKFMGENAGIKGWIISITMGILSVGPAYMWYPFMKDLQIKGIKDKFLSAFLYNRGIKLQWAPMLIFYFGWEYSIILLIVMAVFSVPQGIITEKLINYTLR